MWGGGGGGGGGEGGGARKGVVGNRTSGTTSIERERERHIENKPLQGFFPCQMVCAGLLKHGVS